MSRKILRGSRKARFSIIFFVIVAAVLTAVTFQLGKSEAMPMSPTDETQVPHYFGPYPNWANSPLTLSSVSVEIVGDGTGATAQATVGANGSVTGITVTNPGQNYTTATVNFVGPGTGAAATANVTLTGAVTAITVNTGGAGYSKPAVTIAGGGATIDATATAYGKIDSLTLTGGGEGYTFPTIDFDMPDDPNGVQAKAHVASTALGDAVDGLDANGTITDIVLDDPGSGYANAPKIVIRNGTIFDPITPPQGTTFTEATAAATLTIESVGVDTIGEGYTSVPTVTITETDPNSAGAGATATATVTAGSIGTVTVTNPGTGYITAGGIQKFTDVLPGLCDPAGQIAPACTPTGKQIPLGVPDTTSYPNSDTYVIAVVQYKMQFSSSLPNSTLVRGYVQVETAANASVSQHFPLVNQFSGKADEPVLDINGQQVYGVTRPQYLGPTIAATKDKAVRVVFHNYLPKGMDGSLFLPVDSSIMGSGAFGMNDPYDPTPTANGTVMDEIRNPMCTEADAATMGNMCFLQNRATLHLHGGNTPWISDGTPHQWITPAGESTTWPEGVSVENVPDMNVCNAADDGCQTFYYTNQQSARFMFYHDHSWGITRLNVYAGEAAGYLITDNTEKKLTAAGGALEGLGAGIPLVIQDKTFVPEPTQLAWQDPTWNSARWGGYGNLWYHHVYMPAQNPGDPGGMSAFGRWMYGPWFWPPAKDAKYGPIANPYYDPNCNLDNPATWQYQEDPFCEPELIPGTPNISAGMEQFNDTPLVNGTVYPTLTLEPKSYRLRILNAANDRFWNLQWYVGDPSTLSTSLNQANQTIGATEVALKESEVADAQIDPVVFPTPDLSNDNGTDPSFSLPGPDWIAIGNEGGFLPAPTVIDGQQVTTWITDPTRFDVGNVDQHSLVLAPAERADVVVDFSKFAGQTLILYNDAPAAYPARIPSYDYYTGAPDLSPVGVPTILPGYGPNTRTIMQVKIAPNPPAAAFNLTKLRTAFSHKADGSGVFEAGQPPIIVGQSPYNSAYASSFVSSGWCNAPGSTSTKCDGLLRINEQGGDLFKFNTLRTGTASTIAVKIEPKAIHDETNASSFDEFGRMQANFGVEVVPATPGLQNVVLHPYTFPMTEIIDTSGLPVADVKVTPISSGADGTQVWKITHNGVDTHPVHFHAYDVQVLNRVTWDNIVMRPEANELGWKETLRVSPLQDTIVALRPIIPKLPFDLPNSIRLLSPMNADQAPLSLATVDIAKGQGPRAFAPNGDPIDVYNHYVNFGAEYVYHCHILSHEEMDMMRPVALANPPKAPSGLTLTKVGNAARLTWTDNSFADTSFVVQRQPVGTTTWTDIGTIQMNLDPNLPVADPLNPRFTGVRTFDDTTYQTSQAYKYRVVAQNTVGDTWDYGATGPVANFPTVTTTAMSNLVDGIPPVPTRYDDLNTNLFFTSGWASFSTTGPYAGSYRRTSNPASWAVIAFDGTRLDLISTKGTTLGLMNVSVDGGPITTVNLANATVQYQQNIFTTGVLAPGLHTVKVSWNAGNAAGKFIAVDAVDVLGTLVPFARVDNLDTRVLYSAGNWANFFTTSAWSGSYARASASTSSVTIPFNGVRLDLIATKGTTLGIANVSVDGGTATQVDLANATVLYQQNVFTTGTLANGLHAVTITWNNANAAGKYISLDAVEVFGSLAPLTRVDHTDPTIEYTGNWATFNVGSAYGGSYRRLDTAGSATITFNGARLDWIATRGTTMGRALVSLDGGPAVTVDLANATVLYQQRVWSSGIVTPGVHTVTITWDPTNTAGKFINVDAVDVIGSLQ